MGLYLFVVITEVYVGCLSDKIIRSTTSIHAFHCLPHLSFPPYFPVFSSFHASQSVCIDAAVHSVDIIFPANSYLPWPDIRNYIIPSYLLLVFLLHAVTVLFCFPALSNYSTVS